MSTRSNVVILENGKQLVRIYRQCDGYPTGMGADLKKLLSGGKSILVNGYSGTMQAPGHFNGLGCMAAWLIGAMKDSRIGNVYIDGRKKLGKKDFDIEYEYILSENVATHTLKMEVRTSHAGGWQTIFDGELSEFDAAEVEKREQKLSEVVS